MDAKTVTRNTLAVILLIFCSSCATIFTGASSDIRFESNPPGAEIILGDTQLTTPVSYSVDKRTDEVTFRHPDYEPVVVELDSSLQFGWILMDVLFTPGFGLSGILVDLTTNAWTQLPPLVSYDFETGVVTVGGTATGTPEGEDAPLADSSAGERIAAR